MSNPFTHTPLSLEKLAGTSEGDMAKKLIIESSEPQRCSLSLRQMPPTGENDSASSTISAVGPLSRPQTLNGLLRAPDFVGFEKNASNVITLSCSKRSTLSCTQELCARRRATKLRLFDKNCFILSNSHIYIAVGAVSPVSCRSTKLDKRIFFTKCDLVCNFLSVCPSGQRSGDFIVMKISRKYL